MCLQDRGVFRNLSSGALLFLKKGGVNIPGDVVFTCQGGGRKGPSPLCRRPCLQVFKWFLAKLVYERYLTYFRTIFSIIYLSIFLAFIYPFDFLLSIYLSVHLLFVYLSINLSIPASIYLSILVSF